MASYKSFRTFKEKKKKERRNDSKTSVTRIYIFLQTVHAVACRRLRIMRERESLVLVCLIVIQRLLADRHEIDHDLRRRRERKMK